MKLTLPWPPSVSHYYRRVQQRTLISKEGRRYRREVMDRLRLLGAFSPFDERLSVSITLYPPDRRKRDLDNCMKGLLDALTHSGVWADDSLIDRLLIERADPDKDNPRAEVRIGART